MPAVLQGPKQDELRRTVFKLWRRRFSAKDIANIVGKTDGRVRQILSEEVEEWRKSRKGNPADHIDAQLRELQEAREEAWLAWERSKLDAECTTEEKELRATYREGEGGKQVKTGERLKLI